MYKEAGRRLAKMAMAYIIMHFRYLQKMKRIIHIVDEQSLRTKFVIQNAFKEFGINYDIEGTESFFRIWGRCVYILKECEVSTSEIYCAFNSGVHTIIVASKTPLKFAFADEVKIIDNGVLVERVEKLLSFLQ